jgi:hypothetical protein
MIKKSIYLTIKADGTDYIYKLIVIPNLPRVFVIAIINYYKKISIRIESMLKSRYPSYSDIEVKIQIRHKQNANTMMIDDGEINVFLSQLLLTKNLKYLFPSKVIVSKVHYSRNQVRKHLIRDLNYWKSQGYKNVLVVGKFSHEYFDGMENLNWRHFFDRHELTPDNLRYRKSQFKLDYVAVLEGYSNNNFDTILSEAEIIHVCEIQGFKKYPPINIH